MAVSLVTALAALQAQVGADARWLAALGAEIARLGEIPRGIPYAAFSSAGWHDAPALSQLAFHGLEAGLGERGLVLAQVLAVALALTALSLDLRRQGAADLPSSLVILLASAASASTLLVVRAQLFSLALFPWLVFVLRREERAPSWRMWLLPPLLALWSNLHGGALLGLGVVAAYLLVGRLRRQPGVALAALLACSLALLATPAHLHTVAYYRSVLGSEAAVRGEGLWAPLSWTRPFDLAFLTLGIPLVLAAARARRPLWEGIVLLALTGAAAHSGRNAVWLVLFAAAPAGRWLTGSRSWQLAPPRRLVPVAAALLAGAIGLGLARPPAAATASSELRLLAAAVARDAPILADAENAEALALDGRRVWIANPLDAFPRTLQRAYLDWLAGRAPPEAVAPRARVVLVALGTPAQLRLARSRTFREVGRDEQAVLYARGRATSPPAPSRSEVVALSRAGLG